MEVESFESEEVAKLMNDWFVSVKVWCSLSSVETGVFDMTSSSIPIHHSLCYFCVFETNLPMVTYSSVLIAR